MADAAGLARRGTLLKVALWAFIAMCAQDLLATAMVIAEAHYNAPVAGSLDALQWIAGLFCAALALEEIITKGWRTKRSIVIIAAITAANFAGTFIGVAIGQIVTHHH